ncbi:hypothetical protein [Psychromonas sp. Urea-02u-13]|uniref:hypothetical protein n=1 Tax=Psychromonas sp. Urea-02u-13 TaxID=2058326 RepID=UPI000C320496|nr:hypothetical protein [Psychromonas sp. Urea-02u-13]PKG37283.1 hypothetical protein CXF74_19730 [Psychromonas sp. Urea-02u-13]
MNKLLIGTLLLFISGQSLANSIYLIEVAVKSTVFIVDDVVFISRGGCYGIEASDQIILVSPKYFLNNKLVKLSTGKVCEVALVHTIKEDA